MCVCMSRGSTPIGLPSVQPFLFEIKLFQFNSIQFNITISNAWTGVCLNRDSYALCLYREKCEFIGMVQGSKVEQSENLKTSIILPH